MNRNTLYMMLFMWCFFEVSAGVNFDIRNRRRYVSLMTINEQAYTRFIKTGAGKFWLNRENVVSAYTGFIVRMYQLS
ncbi:hypothetical protein BTO08_07115 [Photobacterium angustum]|uniref:Uncharacterized protein n=1 Tax=Photobacterium angustum TaxID=661 RepID=A0A2S7VZ63_PHOAN|nr:hypothetical protein BTO08_07115 [Photobacterium angustum]